MRDEMNDSHQNGDEQEFAEINRMLRGILGDAAADEIIAQMKAQGFNPAAESMGENLKMLGLPLFPDGKMPQNLHELFAHNHTHDTDDDSDSSAAAQMPKIFSGKNFTIIAQQIQNMLGADGTGPVNWKIAEEVARQTLTQQNQNLDSLKSADGNRVRDALRIASLWLDVATEIGPVTGMNLAWNRLDWIAHSLATYRRLLEPVGANITRAIAQILHERIGEMPPEMQQLLPFNIEPESFFTSLLSPVLGIQYGTALAQLARTSFGTSDTGLPLMEASTAALVPANIFEFAKDLEIPQSEVLAYVAVREVATTRLFTHVPWLRARILDTVAEYARGIQIDADSVEEKIQNISFTHPQEVREIDLTDIFALENSPAQAEALERLEHLISLVEGWVSEVSARAVAPHLPNAVRLREMFTRRYATDNPAKSVWEAQLGMELTPRMVRDAVAFWQLAEAKLGIAQRDSLWNHPDLLPSAQVLSGDMSSFFSDEPANELAAELDSFLADLFGKSDMSDAQEPQSDTQDTPEAPLHQSKTRKK